MKKYYLLAVTLAALASCSSDDFVGNDSPEKTSVQEETGAAIAFGGGFKAITRADSYGKAAADLLGNQFIVLGVKGDGTGNSQSNVFKSYTVDWVQNTAGTTESNTADWEYVGRANKFDLAGAQAIKFWDYSTTAYDFCAYSVGAGNTLITEGEVTAGKILATGINYNATQIGETGKYQISSAYTLKGAKADLAKCYITDMMTITKASGNYQKEVELKFRSLATKVRMALYETVPGYSVKSVEFFQDDATLRNVDISSNTNATLFGTNAFKTGGTYTISFPKIGSGNNSDPDYNKAHVSISDATLANTQAFGALNYTSAEGAETAGDNYLGRSSSAPSFAGTGTWYQDMLPNESGEILEMRVNYTLVSTDGAGEEIKVYGAKAFVPAVYTKWLPNYAYTYIFKISDNTNGWTNPTEDPAGLYPITFDAVVLSSEETGNQTTITTVAKPSITTYQKGHVYSESDEYKVPTNADATNAASNDAIYAQVMNDGTLVTDLNGSGKSFFYKLSETAGQTYTAAPSGWPTGYYTDQYCTAPASGDFSPSTPYYTKGPWSEASVMDALNIQESETSGTIKGRNGITLTPATADYTVVKIPGEDGNWITQYNAAGTPTDIAAGMVAKLSPDAAGTYAYVYKVSDGEPSAVITTVILTSAPTDWKKTDNVYYTDAACTHKDDTDFSNSITLSSEPADWNPVNNVYYTDAACTIKANKAYDDGTYYKNVWYKKYTNLNKEYGVKIIKVVSGS